MRFYEKPDIAAANRFYKSGYLWSSFVLVARASTLKALFRQHLPEIYNPLEKLAAREWKGDQDFLESVFEKLPARSISKHLLQLIPERLRVLPVKGVYWSDWGNPSRILSDLSRLGLLPAGGSNRSTDRRSV